ncbi:Fur family transcriptional regulator [Minwuia sp.]|uniref:Fur family transcriptional regulator n=1 Tax=Minwuia sp. TaxID=2493630 RepID=UPI003A954613
MTESPTRLTHNQTLVHQVLENTEGPLSAYAILDQLRDAGLRAPLQVYRALEKLVERGMVHRLESLNAYVACSHRHRPGGVAVFAICDACDDVTEFQDGEVMERLLQRATEKSFDMNHATVELHGRCRNCREAPAP